MKPIDASLPMSIFSVELDDMTAHKIAVMHVSKPTAGCVEIEYFDRKGTLLSHTEVSIERAADRKEDPMLEGWQEQLTQGLHGDSAPPPVEVTRNAIKPDSAIVLSNSMAFWFGKLINDKIPHSAIRTVEFKLLRLDEIQGTTIRLTLNDSSLEIKFSPDTQMEHDWLSANLGIIRRRMAATYAGSIEIDLEHAR